MNERTVTIAVIAPQEPFEFFDGFWDGAWSAAHEMAPLGVRVLTHSTPGLDANEQARLLRELVGRTVHAVVLLPADSLRLDGLIEQHTLRGTPVVTVFNDAPASRRAAFVGSDFRLSGRLAGDLMSKMLAPRSHIVALTGSKEAFYLAERYEGFRDALRASKAPFGVTEFSDPQHFTEALSGRGQKFDGLYIGCSEAANIRAILEQVRPPARCVTFDVTEAVRPFLQSGTVTAVIDSSRYYQGYLAVQKAYACLTGVFPQEAWAPIPSTVVLPEHVSAAGERSSLNSVFEALVRQRTTQLREYKAALALANGRLMHMAEIDPLTGLLNRRKFEEMVSGYIGHGSLALLLLDLNDSRSLTNLLGTNAAEETQQLIAETLRSVCGAGALLARFGDGEFAVALPNGGMEQANRVGAAVQQAVEGARLAAYPDLRFSVTAGVTALSGQPPGGPQRAGELIDAAHQNLYAAQRARYGLRWLSKTG